MSTTAHLLIDPTETQRVDDWSRLRQALEDPCWDFRTVEGLARSTGLSSETVRKLLHAHGSEVRRSRVRDRQGRDLYALRSRPKTWRELIAEMRDVAARQA